MIHFIEVVGETFLQVSVVFLILNFIIELVNRKLSPQWLRKFMRPDSGVGCGAGAALGMITPLCGCTTAPMVVGLLNGNAGFGGVMSFLFASSTLNPVVLLISFSYLGFLKAFGYVSVMFACCSLLGRVFELTGMGRYVSTGTPVVEDLNFQDRKPMWVSIRDSYLSFLPWLVLGAFINGLFHFHVHVNEISQLTSKHAWIAVPLAAAIGFPLCMHLETLFPIAMALVAGGVSFGIVTAFMISAGGLSLSGLVMLGKVFRLKLLCVYAVVVFLMAIVCGYVINFIL